MPHLAWVVLSFSVYVTVVALVYWPGQVDPDTLDELTEAATGHFQDFHTPLLSLLFRGPYLLGFTSPGWILVASLFTLLVGFYLILRVRFPRAVAAVLAMLCCTWPPVLSWAVHVGRDTWCIAFALVVFGSAARMARMRDRQRTTNLVVCLVSAALCSFSWQISLVPLLVLFALLAYRLLPPAVSWRRVLALAAGLVVILVLYGFQFGAEKAINTTFVSPQRSTFIYDLAQMSKAEGKVLFPRDVRVPHTNTMADIRRVAQTGTIDPIVFGPKHFIDFSLTPAQASSLQHAWSSAVTDNPGVYLDERARIGLALLAVDRPSFWTFQSSPNDATQLPVSPTLRQYGLDFLSLFSTGGNLYGDVLYTGWIYLGFLVAAVPVLLRRRQPGDDEVAAFAIAMILFQFVIIFTIPGLAYRYEYPIVVAGTAVLPVLLPWRWSAGRRNQRGRASPATTLGTEKVPRQPPRVGSAKRSG